MSKQNYIHLHWVGLEAEIPDQSSCWDSKPKRSPLSPQYCGEKSPVGQSPGPFSSLSQGSCFVLAGSIQSGIVGSVLLCPCQQGIQASLTGARHMAPARLRGPDPTSSRTHVAWPTAISNSTHMTTVQLSLTVCDRVCVF